MADHGRKGRVKGFLHGASTEEPPEQADETPEPDAQHDALHVLHLAQRTGDEYVANAKREADRICAEARTQAERIVSEAEAHGRAKQQEADKGLADAQAKAEQVAREAHAHADKARRDAEEILTDARAKAKEIAQGAKASAEEVERQAQRRYEDVVGSLAAKRADLQTQIESLQGFEHEYRSQLTVFLQSQLRALWTKEPEANAEESGQPVVPFPTRSGQAQAQAQAGSADHPQPAAAQKERRDLVQRSRAQGTDG